MNLRLQARIRRPNAPIHDCPRPLISPATVATAQPAAVPAPRPSDTPSPSRWAQLFVLLGLWGFAATQPLLALLGDEPAFFITRRAERLAVSTFVVGLAVVPPLVLWLVTLGVSRLSAWAGRALHLAIVAVLVALAALPLLRSAGLTNAGLMVVGSVALGALFTFLYARSHTVALWSRYTAILPVISLVAFSFSPSGTLIRETSASTSRTDRSDVKSVVFLMLDELPTMSILDESGGVDAIRFPSLAEFASQATWYRNFTTVATGTEQAVPAALTGLVPYNAPPLAETYPDNLFTLLAPTHELTASESLTALCAFSGCTEDVPAPSLAAQERALASDTVDLWQTRLTPGPLAEADLDDFAETLDIAIDTEAAIAPDRREEVVHRAPERFEEFLENLEPSQEPQFDYLHLVLPHGPWRLTPTGGPYQAQTFPAPAPGEHHDEPWLLALLQQRHLYQARYTDGLVAQLMNRLKDVGMYDDSLVVIMADHGVAFSPGHNSRLLTDLTTVPQIAYSPLFIKEPGQTTGRVDEQNVQSIDVVPTIAELLGITVPWEVDGTPIGSPGMAARGGHKTILDFGSLLRPTTAHPFDYEMDETLPDASDRYIGALQLNGPTMAALLEPLQVDPWLGRRLDQVTTGQGMAVSVLSPAGIGRTEGLVRGSVVDPPNEGRVLVAVDGTIVSASPILTIDDQPGSFITLVPPDLVDGRSLRLEFAVVPGPFDTVSPEVIEASLES